MNKFKVIVESNVFNTLERDMREFGLLKPNGKPNKNDFLYNIILKMYEIKKIEREQYMEEFSEFNDCISIVNKAISLNNSIESDCIKKNYLNESITIYSNKSNSNKLDEIIINGAYKLNVSTSAYLRSLLREYASKHKTERQQIYFRELIQSIIYATDNNRAVSLFYENNHYIVLPKLAFPDIDRYDIYMYGVDISNNNPIAFKLSHIKHFIILEDPYYTDIDILEIVEERYVSGNLNSIDELIDIKFDLTEIGKVKYYSNIGKNKYNADVREGKNFSVKCTEDFFFNYFISYGKEISIISPNSLKERFRDFYKESSEQFK